MKDERLLERLKFKEKYPDMRQGHDSAREMRSIIKHISEILNTRQGSCEIHDDLGIPDFMNTPGSNFSDTADELVKSITAVITKFEPRVTDVKVSYEANNDSFLTLKFRLEGKLKSAGNEKLVLETMLSSDGLVRVSE